MQLKTSPSNSGFRQTDRCELVTTVKSTEEFVESLLEKLLLLIHDPFIATQQAMFLKELKCNLQSSEFVVLCDFAENYSFVLQDEAQGFHWNNAQATIHPFVIYLKKSDTLNTEHRNLVMISDCLKHDSILVQTFQWHLMKFIKNTFESPLKKWFTSLMGLQPNTKTKKLLYMHATVKTLECQQSGTSLQHPMGIVLVMGLLAL
jgi:hypothetical protein